MSPDYLHQKLILRHFHEEVSFTHALYQVTKAREEGKLKVSAQHTLFYALYGNPQGIPVVVLHGGPGAGCSDRMSRFFDLSQWNVIMFDQRGSMRSEPFCCMEENSSQHSIADIETLREHLKIKKWLVFGGSWGSTLAVLYGQAHPSRCIGFILRGIFLGREQDYQHLFYGMGKVFPEAYEPFLNYIPHHERDDLLGAYYRRIFDPDPEVHMSAARSFIQFDTLCSFHLPSPDALEKTLQNERLVLSLSRAFFYYAEHRFFLRPNQILNGMDQIAHLPAILVHGRWDVVDLPEMAYALYCKWSNSQLWIVSEGGHSADDPPIAAALATASDLLAQKLSHL